MKITYFKGKEPNFGDELNPWLWPKLIPGFFDDDENTVFIGIGSILGEKNYGMNVKKVVFGAGFVPEYHNRPRISRPDWNVYFVRGPRTAKMLGLPDGLGLGDPAILLRTIRKPLPRAAARTISFMPHWESMRRGNWVAACRLAGINLVDPRLPVETVLHELENSTMVIAEAMHGAIAADALRIPWVPLLPLNRIHRGKWLDWAGALGMKLHWCRLWPSSLEEARLSVLRKPIAGSPLAGLLCKGLTHAAAHRLARLARVAPQLSADREMNRVTDAMLGKIALLQRDFR
ncbi:MAG: polysaccharide pyruvyl transferase family protein [Alphaproteobacteria bacterium]|nr:polysaccharide pyruvyl transferase family protein [Alphaproteobacteria bacterium]MDE2337481.1 polysaccharide pyruvyl transferase family protein [Alphaproteobacteria bacterium]